MTFYNSLKKLGLFSFLFAALLTACKRPSESVGEDLQPESDKLFVQQTDSFDLNVSFKKDQRTRIDLYSNFLAGNYVDDVFGAVKSQAVFQMAPSNTTSLPGANETNKVRFASDSIIIQFGFNAESYGKNVPMYFELNELLDVIDIDSSYYSDFNLHKKSENLIATGHEMQQPLPENIATGGEALYFKLPLKNSLGDRLLNSGKLSSTDALFNELKGFVLSSTTVDGRVLSFSATSTLITIYYHSLNDPAAFGTDANQKFELVYNSSCESFSVIDHQYFHSALSPLSYGQEMDGEELCYLQQPYQTKIRVDLSDALRLNEIPNHSISQAQLIIPFEYTSKFDHIDSLKFSYSTDGGETFTILGKVAADVSGGRYLFNFTTFLNRILNGTINTTDIYISDEPYVSNVNAIGVRRSVLHGPSFSEIDRNKNMRLLVTYAH